MRSAWKELLKSLGITGTEVDPLLEQSVYDEIFTMLVSEYFRSQTDHSTNPASKVSTPVELTSDELNAMRYACGCVPHSLLKKYETKCGNVYSQFVQCLGDMAVEGFFFSLAFSSSRPSTAASHSLRYPRKSSSNHYVLCDLYIHVHLYNQTVHILGILGHPRLCKVSDHASACVSTDPCFAHLGSQKACQKQ